MRNFNNSWEAKSLIINFNQKQWRQDLAAFIRESLGWSNTKVGRSKYLNDTKTKKFEIYNDMGNKFWINYNGKNEIIDSSNNILKGRI